MAKWKIEVWCPPVRDEKLETKNYVVPDPQNWEEFYDQQERGSRMLDEGRLQQFTKSKLVLLNKGVEITKGADPKELVVNDQLLAYLKKDRNIFVKVIGPLIEASPAAAIAATKAKATRRKVKAA